MHLFRTLFAALVAAFLVLCPLARASEDIDDGDVIDVEDEPRSKPDEERDAEEDDETPPPPKKRPSHITPPAPAPAPASPVCGNGKVEGPTETCDDGNTTAGDGCSATCVIEPPPPAPQTRSVVKAPRNKQALPYANDGALLSLGLGATANAFPAIPFGEAAAGPIGYRPVGQGMVQARVRFGSFSTEVGKYRFGLELQFAYLHGTWYSKGYMGGALLTYAFAPNLVFGVGGVGQQFWLNATDGDHLHDGDVYGGALRMQLEIGFGASDKYLQEQVTAVSLLPFVQVGGGSGYDALTNMAYRNVAPITGGFTLNVVRRVGSHGPDTELIDKFPPEYDIIEVYEEVIPESK